MKTRARVTTEEYRKLNAISQNIIAWCENNRCNSVWVCANPYHERGKIIIKDIRSDVMKNRIKDMMAYNYCETLGLLTETPTKLVYQM